MGQKTVSCIRSFSVRNTAVKPILENQIPILIQMDMLDMTKTILFEKAYMKKRYYTDLKNQKDSIKTYLFLYGNLKKYD